MRGLSRISEILNPICILLLDLLATNNTEYSSSGSLPKMKQNKIGCPAGALSIQTDTSSLLKEFLRHKTTCASEMLEKTTCRKICQKRPPMGGGMFGQATRGTCRLGRRRQVHAATAKVGMWLGWLLRRPLQALPPSPLPAWAVQSCQGAATTVAGMSPRGHAGFPIGGRAHCG
jgi:hypothetical protein